MKWTPKQRTIVKHDQAASPKITILEGAVRSGKTFINNALFYKMVRRNSGRGYHYIITGHTIGALRRNVLEPMAEEFGIDTKLSGTENKFILAGNHVHCFGTDKADSYKIVTGMTAHGWYGNEISLSHPNSIQECFNRCSGDDARILWDTNPDYPEHPIKTGYIDRSGELLSNGREHIKTWHFEIDDNPTLSTEYVESLKANTPPGMWYDRKIKGLWVAAEGLVFELFNSAVHAVEPFEIPDHWRKFRAIDYGYENPLVCLWGAEDEDGILYIFDEHYERRMLIKDHAAAIKKRTDNISWTVADHDAQDNAEMGSNNIYAMNANKAVSAGIQKVAERLIVGKNNKPRLYVFKNCVNTLQEFGRYAWAPKKEGQPAKEEPMKVNDHAMDALRYMVMMLDVTSDIQLFV